MEGKSPIPPEARTQLGAYAGDAALNDAVWVDEADDIDPAWIGAERLTDEGWVVTWYPHPLSCIPDNAPAPVITWGEARPPSRIYQLVRAVLVVFGLAACVYMAMPK